MTAQHLYYLFQCFFIYAFLGWCTEVAFAAFKERRFVNRFVPTCSCYISEVLFLLLQSNG